MEQREYGYLFKSALIILNTLQKKDSLQMDLVQLTDYTISDLLKKDVVLPSLYKERFEAYAREYNIDFHDDAFVAHSNEETIQKANDLLSSTNEKIVKLSSTTQDAQDAIRDGDSEKLQRVSSEVEQLKNEMKQLQARVYTDPLTGKYNRQWVSDIFLDNNGMFDNSGSLIFVDLDKFKFINDTYGHNVGDKVLIYISNFLEKKFTNCELIRFAGDEFVLFSSSTHIDTLLQSFAQASRELTQKKIKATNGDLLELDFSFGIASYVKGENLKSIIAVADKLMYQNKHSKKC